MDSYKTWYFKILEGQTYEISWVNHRRLII